MPHVEDMPNLSYGLWERLPVVFTLTEAWIYTDRWEPMNAADANCKAALISEAEFFGARRAIPPLPRRAFKAG